MTLRNWLEVGGGVALLVGGFFVGRAGTGPTALELARADSLRAQAHSLTVTVHTRDSLRSVIASSRHDSTATVVALIAPARVHTDSVIVTVPDTATERRLVEAVADERAASDNALAEFVKDTVAMRHAITSITSERDTALALQGRTQKQLDLALAVRREPAVTLGATGGYGPAWVNGRLVFAPNASVGLTVRLKLPRLLPHWLGS